MPTSLPPLDALLTHGRRTRLALERIDGVRMHDEYRGEYRCGEGRADLVLAPGDRLKLMARVAGGPSPWQALAINRDLPANLRFALAGEGMFLLADMRPNGELDLSSAFDELGQGVEFALRRETTTIHPGARGEVGGSGPLDETALQAVLDQVEWETDAIVRHEWGWELRPKLQGQPVPVRLELTLQGLRLHTVLISAVPSAARGATALQSLRENANLRGARLARMGDELVAEMCLSANALGPQSLASAAVAVAVAKTHTAAVLEVLVQEPDLAKWYAALFASSLVEGNLD